VINDEVSMILFINTRFGTTSLTDRPATSVVVVPCNVNWLRVGSARLVSEFEFEFEFEPILITKTKFD
jgi:hypothetical protein